MLETKSKNTHKVKRINIKERGITLIALVITIIILLILAGVTIPEVLEQNGLFKKAKLAGEEYKESEKKEDQALYDMTNEIDKVSADKAGTNLEIPKNKNWNKEIVSAIADGEGGIIPVPSGFYYAGGSISTGIVISDVENDDLNNSKKGNQFVWIPATAKAYKNAAKYSANEGGKGWPQHAYHTNSTSSTNTNARYYAKKGWSNPEEQINTAKVSIEQYGGFYVARFEAGVPKEATNFYVEASDDGDKNYKRTEKNDIGEDLKPVSKKGNQVWNFINQINAKNVSERMYKNNVSVKSYLIDSNAWNYICEDIFEPILEKQNKTLLDSRTYGNFIDNKTTDYTKISGLYAIHIWKNSKWNPYAPDYAYGKIEEGIAPKGEGVNRLELSTGCCEDFKIYNIYDMAGNMLEWTTETTTVKTGENGETSDNMYAVMRSSNFSYSGLNRPMVYSDGYFCTTDRNVDLGFRTLLYIMSD